MFAPIVNAIFLLYCRIAVNMFDSHLTFSDCETLGPRGWVNNMVNSLVFLLARYVWWGSSIYSVGYVWFVGHHYGHEMVDGGPNADGWIHLAVPLWSNVDGKCIYTTLVNILVQVLQLFLNSITVPMCAVWNGHRRWTLDSGWCHQTAPPFTWRCQHGWL